MKIDDICSPGMVPNAHRLRQETIRAIAFAETLQSSEKAAELVRYFYEAIAYLHRELLAEDAVESEKPTVDASAVSPFDDDDEIPDHLYPVVPVKPDLPATPVKTVGKPAVKGKR